MVGRAHHDTVERIPAVSAVSTAIDSKASTTLQQELRLRRRCKETRKYCVAIKMFNLAATKSTTSRHHRNRYDAKVHAAHISLGPDKYIAATEDGIITTDAITHTGSQGLK